MLPYVRCLSNRYSPRVYIIADTDELSEYKLHAMEKLKEGEVSCAHSVIILTVHSNAHSTSP